MYGVTRLIFFFWFTTMSFKSQKPPHREVVLCRDEHCTGLVSGQNIDKLINWQQGLLCQIEIGRSTLYKSPSSVLFSSPHTFRLLSFFLSLSLYSSLVLSLLVPLPFFFCITMVQLALAFVTAALVSVQASPFLNKRIAQDITQSTVKWEKACVSFIS